MNLKWNFFNNDIATNIFNRILFLKAFSYKIAYSIDIQSSGSKLPSLLINLIYPNFRLRYLAVGMCPKINQCCYALVPFSEPYFYLKSIYIPNKYKLSGKFEAAIIKEIQPELAKFISEYGFNFYDGPDFKTQVTDWIKIYSPITLRKFARKKVKSSLNLNSIKGREKLVFDGELFIKKYVNMNKINDKMMYSRALTMLR